MMKGFGRCKYTQAKFMINSAQMSSQKANSGRRVLCFLTVICLILLAQGNSKCAGAKPKAAKPVDPLLRQAVVDYNARKYGEALTKLAKAKPSALSHYYA